MADICYECQFSDNGYFCRFMEHGVCTAVSCKWMVEFEGRSALDNCKLLNGGESICFVLTKEQINSLLLVTSK